MKRVIILSIAFFFAALVSGQAQNGRDAKKPEKNKMEKRMHAEERSNGHAFSGKGKGGDKNLMDPKGKDKKKEKGYAKKGKKGGKGKKGKKQQDTSPKPDDSQQGRRPGSESGKAPAKKPSPSETPQSEPVKKPRPTESPKSEPVQKQRQGGNG